MAQDRKKTRDSRLEIVAKMYRRCATFREIQSEVIRMLELKTYSLGTVKNDIDFLLHQWREQSTRNIDEYVQLELARIDETVRELWEQWEKSKQDYKKTSRKRKGKPSLLGAAVGDNSVQTVERTESETEVIRLGDVSYLSEIRAQLVERRKLLGLYAPEKKDVTVNEFDLSALTQEQRQALLSVGEQILNEKE